MPPPRAFTQVVEDQVSRALVGLPLTRPRHFVQFAVRCLRETPVPSGGTVEDLLPNPVLRAALDVARRFGEGEPVSEAEFNQVVADMVTHAGPASDDTRGPEAAPMAVFLALQAVGAVMQAEDRGSEDDAQTAFFAACQCARQARHVVGDAQRGQMARLHLAFARDLRPDQVPEVVGG